MLEFLLKSVLPRLIRFVIVKIMCQLVAILYELLTLCDRKKLGVVFRDVTQLPSA